jgi:hypothetical protein
MSDQVTQELRRLMEILAENIYDTKINPNSTVLIEAHIPVWMLNRIRVLVGLEPLK